MVVDLVVEMGKVEGWEEVARAEEVRAGDWVIGVEEAGQEALVVMVVAEFGAAMEMMAPEAAEEVKEEVEMEVGMEAVEKEEVGMEEVD